jgi:hypothetical protein
MASLTSLPTDQALAEEQVSARVGLSYSVDGGRYKNLQGGRQMVSGAGGVKRGQDVKERV